MCFSGWATASHPLPRPSFPPAVLFLPFSVVLILSAFTSRRISAAVYLLSMVFFPLLCLLSSLLSCACWKAAVLEDALDGVQDSPMLSMSLSAEGVQHSRPSSTAGGGGGGGSGGGGGGGSGDERGDGSVHRLESLRELLAAALNYHPDLPLGLCVKSKSALFRVCVLFLALIFYKRQQCMYALPANNPFQGGCGLRTI